MPGTAVVEVGDQHKTRQDKTRHVPGFLELALKE